jgi:hypothetical protein
MTFLRLIFAHAFSITKLEGEDGNVVASLVHERNKGSSLVGQGVFYRKEKHYPERAGGT